MDSSAYKDFKTTRGINYHYYFSPPKGGNSTLLLCHGFPSSSYDWHHQVEFFKDKGYGLLVPDMLGYGGTDKPITPEAYRTVLLTKDMVELLDAERLDNVIAIGHDWGCRVVSGLALSYPTRFLAFGFLAVPYLPPRPTFDYDTVKSLSIKTFGYATMGYWTFFSGDGTEQVIESHLDSFFSLLYPSDPNLFRTDLAPEGKAKEWCLADRKEGYASYIADDDKKRWRDTMMKGGFAAPLCWYKVLMQKLNATDDAEIPLESYTIKKPVFFGAALKDYVCLAAVGKHTTQQFCPKATVVDFDTDHWVMLADPHKTNSELLKWIEVLVVSQSSL